MLKITEVTGEFVVAYLEVYYLLEKKVEALNSF